VSFPHPAGAATSGSGEELDPDEVGQLTPRQREILGLKADEYSNVEIAEMLGISDVTVRSQMHRARQKIARDRPDSETENITQQSLSLPPSVRAHVRGTAMARANNGPWPDGSFVQQLSDADRAALLDAGTPVRFEDDEILLVQGDTGDFLYVLTSGLVKIIVAAVSGAQTMLAIRSRGDILGEFSVLDNMPRTSTARAAGPVTAVRVDGTAFLTLASQSPAFQAAITRSLIAKVRATTERRAAERVWDARERLAQVLFDLGQRHTRPGSDGLIRVPITQSELGELAGVAASTAERVLKDLRKHGTVSTRYREITIRDMAYLDRIRFLGRKPETP
jgi:CRP/FNR family cyclic AMP-dependent transcriptional regulator